jgi:hypothetical protein
MTCFYTWTTVASVLILARSNKKIRQQGAGFFDLHLQKKIAKELRGHEH